MKKTIRPLQLKTVVKHRREECIHYDACLEEASAMLWPSFSCEGCCHFIASKEKQPEQHRAASPLGWEM